MTAVHPAEVIACPCGLPGDVHLDADGRLHHVTGYAAARDVLDSDDFGVEYPFRASRQLFGPTVLDLDGPRHQRLRGAMAPPMRAAQMERMVPALIDPVVRAVLTELPVGEEFDLVERVARVVPARVITGYLGLPPEHAERTYALLRPVIDYINDPHCSLAEAVAARDALEELHGQFLDNPRHRSSWSSPEAGKGLNRLDDDERLRAALILMAAGTETTVHAISLAVHLLLSRPDLCDQLRRSPASLGPAIGELMRLTPPLTSTVRFAKADTVVAGQLLPRGAVVEVSLLSANADPRAYADPATFSLSREERGEPRTLTFGGGRHVCPGAALATLEVQSLLRMLLAAGWPLVVTGPLEPPTGRTFLGPERLDVVLTATAVPTALDDERPTR